MIELRINGAPRKFDGDPEMPLLWYLRDELDLTGTKFGCGMGLCGACTIHVNGVKRRLDADADRTLLSVLREDLDLTGAKYGCGEGQCGACTVLIDGAPTRSCVTPVRTLAGKEITTIEGLSKTHTHPLQKAWKEGNVPQCGYCQSGQIMQAASLLKQKPKPTDQDIDEAMAGNICRCGTYQRIRAAIKTAAVSSAPSFPPEPWCSALHSFLMSPRLLK